MNGHDVGKTVNGLYRVVGSCEDGERQEQGGRTVRTQVPLARWLCWWLAFENLGIVVDAVRLLDEFDTVFAGL